MEELNSKLEVFHRLARKYRTQPETLKEEYETWQSELEQLHQLEDPETLAEQVEKSHQEFLEKPSIWIIFVVKLLPHLQNN